jgi:hypothetical protein
MTLSLPNDLKSGFRVIPSTKASTKTQLTHFWWATTSSQTGVRKSLTHLWASRCPWEQRLLKYRALINACAQMSAGHASATISEQENQTLCSIGETIPRTLWMRTQLTKSLTRAIAVPTGHSQLLLWKRLRTSLPTDRTGYKNTPSKCWLIVTHGDTAAPRMATLRTSSTNGWSQPRSAPSSRQITHTLMGSHLSAIQAVLKARARLPRATSRCLLPATQPR